MVLRIGYFLKRAIRNMQQSPVLSLASIGTVAVALALLAVDHARALLSEPIVFDPEERAAGTFPAQWIHGSKSAMDNDDPPVQVHAYNEHTIIMRENKAINYEGAFMYLFFGKTV